MAHYAKIDENNTVLDVVVVSNEHDEDGNEFLNSIGLEGRWLKTSYNTVGGTHIAGGTPFRKNFAGIGGTYDEVLDAFIPPVPEQPSTLDPETCLWVLDDPSSLELDPTYLVEDN